MASAASAIKSAALRLMPDAVLLRFKKVRYLGAIRSFWSPEAAIMTALVRPGDHVLDVGAHAGWYTRVLAEAVGPGGRVYSVEPIPPTFTLLSFCVRRLGLANVTLFNCAASRESGRASMEVPEYPTGGENFYRASLLTPPPGTGPTRSFSVDVRTVDSLLGTPPPRITFIKVDVEGHEAEALAGAGATIARDHPALCVEVTGDPDVPGSGSQTLVAGLAAQGYRAYWLDGGRLVARRPGDRSVNYFFVNAAHLDALEARGQRIG
jgi:FkbM family methyltransferase